MDTHHLEMLSFHHAFLNEKIYIQKLVLRLNHLQKSVKEPIYI